MKRLLFSTAFLVLISFSGMLSAADSVAPPPPQTPVIAHLEDPAKLLPPDTNWAKATSLKLAEFERTAGVKLLVRFHPKSPTPEEDKQPGAYMRALATQLGTVRHGVLAVYFAHEDDWRVWIGDELTARFSGRPGSPKELTESGAIHEVKEALLTACREKSEVAFATLRKLSPPNHQPTPADRVRLQTEALIDALIIKLGPK